MINVVIKVPMSGGIQPGSVMSLPEKEADRLIAKGLAETVDAAKEGLKSRIAELDTLVKEAESKGPVLSPAQKAVNKLKQVAAAQARKNESVMKEAAKKAETSGAIEG